MSDIIIISGSPSIYSRSQSVLKYIGNILMDRGFSVSHITVRDVPAEDLMFGNFSSPEVNDIGENIKNAKGIIVGSPVYKGAYSGVLKSLFDILPRDVFKDKPVVPVMSGGSISHLLALEYSLKPLISTLKGTTLKGVYYLDSQVDKTADFPILDKDLIERTESQIDDLLEKMDVEKSFS